jgi:hypothetical protein
VLKLSPADGLRAEAPVRYVGPLQRLGLLHMCRWHCAWCCAT